jgi:hypothetical protein
MCRRHSQWIPDGCVQGKVMFVGGAQSSDRRFCTSGYDRWPQEQLSEDDFGRIIEKYLRAKPAIVVSHDCQVDVLW